MALLVFDLPPSIAGILIPADTGAGDTTAGAGEPSYSATSACGLASPADSEGSGTMTLDSPTGTCPSAVSDRDAGSSSTVVGVTSTGADGRAAAPPTAGPEPSRRGATDPTGIAVAGRDIRVARGPAVLRFPPGDGAGLAVRVAACGVRCGAAVALPDDDVLVTSPRSAFAVAAPAKTADPTRTASTTKPSTALPSHQ